MSGMNKETSLASQLRKLEAPQTNILRETKSRASFLYDRKEALSIDKDTHFIIGSTGFRQICSIDQSLVAFEELFSVTNKDLDRAVKSKEDNEQLNKLIRSFLFQGVSPYFLLTHTHKVLEWLIYRYSIHEYNLDDLMIAVLPYHETKLFPRVVQLSSKIRDPTNKWHWLLSVSKNSVPLPKVSLISHLKSSSVTIEYLKEAIIETVRSQHKIPTVVSFFTSTLVTLLEDDFVLTDTFKDKYITIILGYLFYGTKSKDSGLVQSCYIVLSQLVTRVSLKVSKLEKLLSKMAKYLTEGSDPATKKNFLLTLLIVYEFQELERIPETVVNALNLDSFIEITGQIHSKYFLTSLLTYYIGRCEENDSYMKCMKLIDNLKMSTWTITKVLEAVVEKKSSEDSEIKSKLSNIVQVLERRFPTEFDGATSKANIKGLGNLIVSPFYTKLHDKNLNVFVGLCSANEGIRLHSACHIAKNHKEILKCTDEKTKQMIADSLTNTLHEVNPLVLIELLSCRDLFIKMVPLTDLIVYGKKLLPRCIEMIRRNKDDEETHNDWTTVRRSCFKLVSNLDFNESQFWDLFVDYFLPLDETGLSLFSVIFETDIEKTNRKLFDWTKSIYTEELKTSIANEDYGSSIDLVTQRIAQYIFKNSTSPLLEVLDQPGSENYRKQILGLCVIFHLLPLYIANDNYEAINKLSLTCISILTKLVDPSTVRFKKTSFEDDDYFDCIKDFINSSINYLTKKRVTSSMVQLFVTRLLDSKISPPSLKPWFWHLQTTENNYIHGLFNFLCNNCHHEKVQAQPVFQNLLKFFVKQIQTFCPKFLVGLWTKTEDPLLQARSLQISSFFMVESDFSEIELVSLCIALQSLHSSVREVAVKLLAIDSKPGTFIQFLNQYSELLAGDSREISIALAKYWTNNEATEIRTPTITFTTISKLIKQDPNTPASIRVALASMLRDYNNVDCLKLFMSLLNFQASTVSERQLTYLAGRKMIEMLPVLEDLDNISIQPPLGPSLQRLFISDDYRPMLLNLFNNLFVKQLTDDAKRLIIECLLDVIQVQNDNFSRRKLRKFLNDGSLVSYIIGKIIESNGDLGDSGVGENEVASVKPKRRRLEKKIVLEQDSDKWKKIVILLEIFASKEIFTGAEDLMGTVFKLLKENLLSEEQSSSEYFRSLLLVILSNCLNQPEIDLANFELVYILESLRHARLRETRMQALTIINRISGHLKDDILRDIIVIFGFIGNDMIKCDDQYTHKILDDTMETIIPGLVMSSEDSQKKIIETFTDAFKDIPLHRRLYLFQKLTSLLGEEQFLWYIVYKLIRRSLEIEESRKFIQEFISALVTGFDAVTQMTTINQLMSMCHKIVDDGSFEALGESIRFPEIVNRVDFAKETVVTIYQIVSSEDYVSAIAKSKWSDMEVLFNQLFETNLLLIDYCNKTENKSTRITSRLNREALNVLEKVNVLLPGPEFISVIHRLLGSETLVVRRKALDLLNGRLTTNKSRSQISMLRNFIQPIVNIIGNLKENKSDIQIVTSQTGLITIGLLSKILQGDTDSIDYLVSALKSIVSLCEDQSQLTSTNLIASMILCISQMVSCLKTDCLSLIPPVMSIILSTLKQESEVLLLSSLTALSKITLYFGKYLSSNLCQLLTSICTLNRNSNYSGMNLRIDKVIINIANEVPFRILIESLEEAFDQLDSSEPRYICLTILHRGLKDCDKNEIEPNMVNLQKFALKLLDYRSINCNCDDITTINKIEDKSLEAITSFVPKLSEASFRSFFYKVYDWVKTGDGNNNYHRVLTFYRLTNRLADKLKNLFSAFAAPYIVINCIKQLKAFHISSDNGMLKLSNDAKSKAENEQIGHLIISNILTTLAKSFQHDVASTFATSDRSKKLFPLILDQITNDFGSNDQYYQRIDEGVIPCIQNLVKAVNDHNIVKDTNYQLLLKTRENSAKVRHQALHVLHQLILSMTEEYTPYIPEAVPFLAELHEDDSEEIQKLLLTVFGDIEKIFGEPINSYF